MKVTDAYRAQFFLKKLLKAIENIDKKLIELSSMILIDRTHIKESLAIGMSDELDRIILPALAHEIRLAKDKDFLKGCSPQEKYVSFFLQEERWTESAINFLSKYRYLDELIDVYIKTFSNNILEMLARFQSDFHYIYKKFGLTLHRLKDIQSNKSDRHRNGRQVVLLFFNKGQRLIYKPSSLESDLLFDEYVNFLELPAPYNLKVAPVLNKEGYGWIKYLDNSICESQEQIKKFYTRAGVLLAVADQLNYTDGHLENLIACSEYPVLIDLETIFHPLAGNSEDSERSILNTGLVEKPPPDLKHKGFTAALQTPSYAIYEVIFPYPINDKTDQIEIRFRGLRNSFFSNSPVLDNVIYSPIGFIKEFLDGYRFGAKTILDKSKDWIANKIWWERAKTVDVRLLVRHTLFYELMSRKAQQPNVAADRIKTSNYLHRLMRSNKRELDVLLDYEINDLLLLNIPYFKHHPDSRDIIDGNNNFYSNYLIAPTIKEVLSNFHRKRDYFKRNFNILANILKASPQNVHILS
jgi:type 2 lantibiotic biosynthesis protein LanM